MFGVKTLFTLAVNGAIATALLYSGVWVGIQAERNPVGRVLTERIVPVKSDQQKSLLGSFF